MKAKLTKKLVESIPVPEKGETIVWDSVQQGFHVKVYPSGKRSYHVYYRNAAGQQRRPKIALHGDLTVGEARVEAGQIIRDAGRGSDLSANRRRQRSQATLAEFWVRYRRAASMRWKPRTVELHEWLWTKHIEPSLGKLPIGMIDRLEVKRLHDRLEATPTSANQAVRLVRAMLNAAMEAEVLPRGDNPAARVKLYPERPRERFLAPAQMLALLHAIDEEEALAGKASLTREGESTGRGGKDLKETASRGISTHAAALLRLLIYTGARLSEIQTATWPMVDWQAGALRLPDSKTGRKSIWLNSAAKTELERLHKLRRQDLWIIEGRIRGQPLINARKPWQRVCKRAGLASVRLHDLRHTYASLALTAGIPLAHVGSALGHTQARTTERYAHLIDDPAKAAAAAVEKALTSTET